MKNLETHFIGSTSFHEVSAKKYYFYYSDCGHVPGY